MAVEQERIAAFLKTIHLFRAFAPEQLERIASWFTLVSLKEGDRLQAEGDPAGGFYLLFEGSAVIQRERAGAEGIRERLTPGDFFGEETLLFGRVNPATLTAAEPTLLLFLTGENFQRLADEIPQVRLRLARDVESRRIALTRRFAWLNPEEVIYQVRRKHEAYLLLGLLGPFLLALVALLVLSMVSSPEVSSTAWVAGASLAGLLALLAAGWGVWKWIDWSNDYYVITDQRVVWTEQVIWLYDSRVEAPLSTILSVNVTTSQIGRILGYGDVIVRTFTGQVVFRNVGQPYEMAAMVEEYWHRAQKRSREAEEQEMEQAVRHLFDQEAGAATAPAPPPPEAGPAVLEEPGRWRKYFANFFKMRFEEGNVITYRKFWTVLLAKTWLPTLAILLDMFGMAGLILAYLMEDIQRPRPDTVLLVGLPLLVLIFLPWWAYHYVDWRNDIYQVTDRNIFDIERRPLGTEVRKSAPLESILSLEHERIGFLGYLFNFGNVTINVGDARFVFLGVHNPAQVQQDVFNRMHAFRRQKELAEVARQRDRVVQMLSTYHQNLERFRGEEESQDFGGGFEVK